MFRDGGATVLVGMMAAIVAGFGCASQESADGQQTAMAVAVDDSPAEAETGSAPTDAGSDGQGGRADSIGGLVQKLQPEDVARAVNESVDPKIRDIADALGLVPTVDRCDGGPCQVCRVGWHTSSATGTEERPELTGCCTDEGCLTEIAAVDREWAVGVFGPALEPVVVGGDSVVVSPRASTADHREVFAVSTETLRQMGRQEDGARPLVGVDDLRDEAVWRLDPSSIHRLEALPARAVDQARDECGAGVHLPTLEAMAAEVSPRSEQLELVFERRLGDGDVLLSTTTDDKRVSKIRLTLDSMCMHRSGVETGVPARIDVETGDDLWWHHRDGRRLDEGQRTVVRGQLLGVVDAGDAAWFGEEVLQVTAQQGPRPIEADRVEVFRRHLSAAELHWWWDGGVDVGRLRGPGLDVPVRSRDARRSLPMTVVVDGDVEADELTVGITAR